MFRFLRKSKKFNRSGRNGLGVITVRHRGGGFRNQIRLVDFRRRLFGQIGIVQNILKDPNRTGNLGLILYRGCGLFSYFLSPENLKVGDLIGSNVFNMNVNFRVGFSSLLKNIPLSVPIFNIELYKHNGGKLIKSAGTFGIIVRKMVLKNGREVSGIKLPSSRVIYISSNLMATIGKVSNLRHYLCRKKKAGQNRWIGVRPSVRGVAMNPVDHPHGGGEGKSSGGRPSVSPWGKLTKGYKTVIFKKKKKFLEVV